MNAPRYIVELLPVAEALPDATIELAEDADLRNRVHWYLARTGHRPLRLLNVEVRDGVVTLSGLVTSYYQRQLAIACQHCVAGVRCLIDLIDTGP